MSTKTKKTGGAGYFTDHELKLLNMVWQCLRSPPDVDTEKLATMGGYKTKHSANTAFHNLRKKIMAQSPASNDNTAEGAEDGDADPLTATSKPVAKVKAAVKTDESSDSDDDTIAVQAPKVSIKKKGTAKKVAPKGRGRGKKAVKEESSDEDDTAAVTKAVKGAKAKAKAKSVKEETEESARDDEGDSEEFQKNGKRGAPVDDEDEGIEKDFKRVKGEDGGEEGDAEEDD